MPSSAGNYFAIDGIPKYSRLLHRINTLCLIIWIYLLIVTEEVLHYSNHISSCTKSLRNYYCRPFYMDAKHIFLFNFCPWKKTIHSAKSTSQVVGAYHFFLSIWRASFGTFSFIINFSQKVPWYLQLPFLHNLVLKYISGFLLKKSETFHLSNNSTE